MSFAVTAIVCQPPGSGNWVAYACSFVADKKIIETFGAVEVLGALLKSEDINVAAKTIVRYLIHGITAP